MFKRANKSRLICLVVMGLSACAAAAEPQEVPLWPQLDRSLIAVEQIKERGTPQVPNRFISDIRYPTLTIYRLDSNASTTAPAARTAIIICPGGAYAGVAID